MKKQERTITFSEDELNRIYIDYRNIRKAASYSNGLTIAMFSTTTLSKIEELEKFVIVHSADEAVSEVSAYFDLLPQQIGKIKTDDGTYHIKVCIPLIGNNFQRMKNAMYVCGFHFVSRQETTIGEHRFEWLQFMPEKPMPTYEEWKKEQESDEDLGFRLSNLLPKRTGLPMTVWIEEKALPTANSSRSCSTYRYDRMPKMRFINNTSDSLLDSWLPISVEKENPRILVKDYELNISDKDFILLKKWIVRNCDTLTDYWNGEIDTVECFSKLQKI